MASKAFQPSLVHDEPNMPIAKNTDHGDVPIRGLWKIGNAYILDICVTDTYDVSYHNKEPHKVLKRKHLQLCLEKDHHLTPSMLLIDNLVGKEDNMGLRVLATITVTQAEKSYP
jgi:hypothetical protein